MLLCPEVMEEGMFKLVPLVIVKKFPGMLCCVLGLVNRSQCLHRWNLNQQCCKTVVQISMQCERRVTGRKHEGFVNKIPLDFNAQHKSH